MSTGICGKGNPFATLDVVLASCGRAVCATVDERYVCSCADDTSSGEQRLEEMRALLAERREHVPLWHAYGQQLYKAGQAKVIFYASCHCLGACISCI